MNTPNLECMSNTELRAYYAKHCDSMNMVERKLADFAALAIEARQARGNGKIDTALAKEERMDRIYDSLPEESRW